MYLVWASFNQMNKAYFQDQCRCLLIFSYSYSKWAVQKSSKCKLKMLCYKTKKCKSYLWPLLLLQPSYPSCKYNNIIEMQQHLNKVNNRIHVKITCRVFDLSLNNKTTVTYVMMQTKQKDSFFKIIDSLMKYMGVSKPVISIQSRFDTNSSSEILQKVWSLQKKFEQEKHFGWLFFIL